jgi:hypothetical protein
LVRHWHTYFNELCFVFSVDEVIRELLVRATGTRCEHIVIHWQRVHGLNVTTELAPVTDVASLAWDRDTLGHKAG